MSVICALCGARHRSQETVLWLGPSWDEREPYCADDCARTLTARGVRRDRKRDDEEEDGDE